MSDALHGKRIGYRAWRVSQDDSGALELHSAGAGDHHWHSGPNEAKCPGADLGSVGFMTYSWGTTHSMTAAEKPWFEQIHQAPDQECGCGLYAHYVPPLANSSEVIGAVVGWGRTALHPDGWRAQWAQPVVIGLPEGIAANPLALELLRECAYSMGCIAVPLDKLEEAALEFGQIVPAEERPVKPEPKPKPKPSTRTMTLTNAQVTLVGGGLAGDVYFSSAPPPAPEPKPAPKRWWSRRGRPN